MNLRTLASLALILPGAFAGLSGSGNAELLVLSTVSSTGTNTSLGAAQLLDNSDATILPLFSAALKAFDALNSDTVHQNASSLTTAGQAVSPEFSLSQMARFPYRSTRPLTRSATSGRRRQPTILVSKNIMAPLYT
jgi:hypothetical protein